ncbi:hypothetical protein Zmor_018856 [Zophobas morio]|uniref:Uncharacterized protein n=1 Tax=Zophobas morio TaxID=2755281 RepID=A0AA38I880_9CUCU|nr:hypothetical protein Zmor_018856 [Zophobas morio]
MIRFWDKISRPFDDLICCNLSMMIRFWDKISRPFDDLICCNFSMMIRFWDVGCCNLLMMIRFWDAGCCNLLMIIRFWDVGHVSRFTISWSSGSALNIDLPHLFTYCYTAIRALVRIFGSN